MEEELKCPVCRRLFTTPVFLPCTHSVCLACALTLQVPFVNPNASSSSELSNTEHPSGASSISGSNQTLVSTGSGHSGASDRASSNGSNTNIPLSGDGDFPDVDKLSLLSETDSGVVVNSRPNSYVGTPSVAGYYFHGIQGPTLSLPCPVCKKVVYLDDQGANILPKNRALESIVDKYGENKNITTMCQLCAGEDSKPSTIMCEQCEVFYCDGCRESCHPARGPLAQHNLVTPTEGKPLLRNKHKIVESKCLEHTEENLSLYCILCKMTICCVCAYDGRHINHDAQPLGACSKAQKTELSQLLHQLSEKARSGTEFIQRLKSMEGRIQENCVEFEALVVAQCDSLVDAVKRRKEQLLANIKQEKEQKQRIYREQVTHCTARLQHSTGLLQFSIEVLKESDPGAFLQMSHALLNRVGSVETGFNKDMEMEPRVPHEFELNLDNHAVLHAINTLNFFQMKAPSSPQFLADDCSAENNTVTVCWQPQAGSAVEGYVLELDDGNEGDFREVYTGKETICTVEGLHFDSMYNARVRAYNNAGMSDYSECICLQTAEVAWFCLDPSTAHPDMLFDNNNLTATCSSYDDRVVLSTVGFSKGVHYWEITIDRYDNTPDPAFGIARFDVAKDCMLGKDSKGWSMYIDSKRSWFMHGGQHTDRAEGGIRVTSVVGVLLDLNQHTMCFYINDEAHGPIAFTALHGVFYPAISLNRNVQVTIHTGLEPPVDDSTDDS